MGKLSQKKGKAGEEAAMYFLKSIGAKCIEKIPTLSIYCNGKVVFPKKSSVDIICALPSPGCIHPYYPARIEVKVEDGNRLMHSRLSDHQVKWLKDWVNIGFYSFIIWVHKSDIIMFKYPNDLFKYGKSLSIKDTEKIQIYQRLL